MFNKSMCFIRRLNRGNLLSFKPEISNLVDNYASHDKMQNFSSISPKLCLLGQKYTGTLDVNTTQKLTRTGWVWASQFQSLSVVASLYLS